MPASSTFDPQVILSRLTIDRLRSYLEDCDNDLDRALDLYAWNAQIAAAFLEDLGRLEVVLRNRVAHHEPLHRRELAADAALILELIRWMCSDMYAWMAGLSRVPAVLASRPA